MTSKRPLSMIASILEERRIKDNCANEFEKKGSRRKNRAENRKMKEFLPRLKNGSGRNS